MIESTFLRRLLALLAVFTLGFGAAACADDDGAGGGDVGGEGGADLDMETDFSEDMGGDMGGEE